jgi:hypothetical protein
VKRNLPSSPYGLRRDKYVFVPPFFWQKNGGWKFLSSPAILKGFLRQKLQNFAVKSNSEKRFTFVQKNSECAAKKQKKIDKRGKNLSFAICNFIDGNFISWRLDARVSQKL